jgi:hypothetical protein
MSQKSKRVKATKPKCKTVSRRRISGGWWPFSSNNDTKPADGTPTATAQPTSENKSSITDRLYSYFPSFNMSGTSVAKESTEGKPVVKEGQAAVVSPDTKTGGKKRSKKSHTSRKHRKTNKNAAK